MNIVSIFTKLFLFKLWQQELEMDAADTENIAFDVVISEESDLDIVLASIDESLEIYVTEKDVNNEEYENLDRIPDITFVKEDNVFLVIQEQHNVELSFVKDPV